MLRSMRSRLTQFMVAEHVTEPNDRRMAQVTIWFSASAFVLGGVHFALAHLLPQLKLRADLFTVSGTASFLVPLLLAGRGRVSAGAVLLLALSWLGITALCLTNNGLAAQAANYYLVLLLTAGLLTGGRAIVPALLVGIVTVFTVGYLAARDLLPQPMHRSDPLGRATALALSFLWLAIMMHLILRQLQNALERAELENDARRKNAAELRIAEGELRALNAKLEERVTERTAELSLARERALAANRAKGEFLATMSHELRTPLAGIIGLIELLDRVDLPPQARPLSGSLRSSSQLLLTIIGDILDYSKIEAGMLSMEKSAFELGPILEETLLLLRSGAEAKRLRLVLDVAPEVPQHIVADPMRLRQILFNLVGNALKFTERGSVSVTVRYAADTLQVRVQDSGIGMSEEVMSRLFQPFTQADNTTTRRYGGTGLRLVIVRRLVELHGGRIEVQSRLGEGSCFTFSIAAPVGHPIESPRAAASFAGRPLHILVAEDNEINALVLTGLLSKLGHTFERVADGGQALERAAQGGYQVILMDMQMPVLDGTQATQRIRALPGIAGRVPIIGLSADAVAHHSAVYLASGLNAYLVKPCSLAQLRDTLLAVMADTSKPS